MSQAEILKQAGNEAWKRGESTEALRYWRRSLEHLTADDRQFSASLHNNCALALLRLCQWKEAIASAGIALASEPKNEKALWRRAQARLAINDVDGAREDLLAARSITQGDASIAAWTCGVLQADKRGKAGFTPRGCLPRTRPSMLSHIDQFVPLGHDDARNIFAADAESGLPALSMTEQDELSGYFGGAADGRHFFATVAELGVELAKVKAGTRLNKHCVRLYLNDINPAAIVRQVVLLCALDRLAQCGDLDTAVKDPRGADRETATAAFLLTNLFISSCLYEEQHKTATGLLQAFVNDPRKTLPKWLTLGPRQLEQITDAANKMLKNPRTWTGELPRTKATFEERQAEQLRNLPAQRVGAPKPKEKENVIASFFEQSIGLGDQDINERFAHVEAKNAEERRAKLASLRQIALSLPSIALEVAETMPMLIQDLSFWVQNYRLAPPAQLRYLESTRLYINPTFVDERWLSRGGKITAFPQPGVILAMTAELTQGSDQKTKRLVAQLDSCANVMAVSFCRAAQGLRRFLKGENAPDLQVMLRLGDLAADLDDLGRDQVYFDRISGNNVGDYIGLNGVVISGARALRMTSKKASIRANILLATSQWGSPEQYIWEYCRVRPGEVKTLLHLQPKVTTVWNDLVFTTADAKDCITAGAEVVHEWLAGLFIAMVCPAKRELKVDSPIITSSNMAAWFAICDFARARHGDAGVLRVVQDLLHNRVKTRHRFPTEVPDKIPGKKKVFEDINVRAYLAELRALTTLWLLPSFGIHVPDPDLLAAGVPRSGIALEVGLRMPMPAGWHDDFSCGDSNNMSLSLAIFASASEKDAKSLEGLQKSFPACLVSGDESVHVFTVLHWDSAKHFVRIWLTAQDCVNFQGCLGSARLFRSDNYTFVTGPVDIKLLGSDIVEQIDGVGAAGKLAAAGGKPAFQFPPAGSQLPVVIDRGSDQIPSLIPQGSFGAALAAGAPMVIPPIPPFVPPGAVAHNIGGTPPAAQAFMSLVPQASTLAHLQPTTAAEPATSLDPWLQEPFIPIQRVTRTVGFDFDKPERKVMELEKRVTDLEQQNSALMKELERAKQEAKEALGKKDKAETELRKMSEENAWLGGDAAKRGGGAGRGKKKGK